MDLIYVPWVLAIDTREKAPYHFQGIPADKAESKNGNLFVQTEVATIRSGDYSILGLENHVAIERKSKSDAYQTFGSSKNRDRFKRELSRLDKLTFSAVVIEAGWDSISIPPLRTKVKPKTIVRSIMSWQVRYRTKFMLLPNRSWSERITFRLLQKFWNEHPELHGLALDAKEKLKTAKDRLNDQKRLGLD